MTNSMNMLYMIINFYPLIIILTMLSITLIHPMIMMINLIIFTLMISLNMNFYTNNSFYPIIIIIIIVGGMMIMFLYFSSLISNEKIKLNFNMIINYYTLTIMLIISQSFNWMNFINYKMKINDTSFFMMYKNMNIFIYNFPLNYLTILCIMYLMMCMFLTIKICKNHNFAMRKML